MATFLDTMGPQTAPPCYAGGEPSRALALAVYDPATAAEHAKRERYISAIAARNAKRKKNISPNAGALVPFMAHPPIHAVPLAAAAPNRTEPSWIRTRLLRQLNFRLDMDVHFMGEKTVTPTDLDIVQNRFRLPNEGVERHLMGGMLSEAELRAANLLHLGPRPPKQPRIQGGIRTKRQGEKHGGLPMVMVDADGRKKELKLVQWESSRSTVIHGHGYLNFMAQCSFKRHDVVEIWAFREKTVRLFGVNIREESPLHILIAKKEQELAA